MTLVAGGNTSYATRSIFGCISGRYALAPPGSSAFEF
jgi:hypothetical protein